VGKESGNESTNNSVFSETGYNDDEEEGEGEKKNEEKEPEMMVSDAVST